MSHHNDCEKDCKTRCNFDVGVKVETDPRVRACEIGRHSPVQFPVDFTCTVNPRCKVKQICTIKDKKGCQTGCSFLVDVEFDCNASVDCGSCPSSRAQYNVKVDAEHDVKCYLEDKPHHREPSRGDHESSNTRRHRKRHSRNCPCKH